MEQLGGAGLLLIDIRYRGEDAVRGSLRRTSMDVSAVGSYKDLTAALELLAAQPLLRMETLALDRQRPENRLIEVKDEAEHAGSAAMSRARVGMAAALLAACGVAGIARAGNVDIFRRKAGTRCRARREGSAGRTRTGRGCGRGAAAAQRSWSAQAADAVAAPLFARVGEWREAGQRIVVLRSEDRLYLLCRRCAAPSRAAAGGAARDGYRLKSLEPDRAVLLAPDGQEVSVDLPVVSEFPQGTGSS